MTKDEKIRRADEAKRLLEHELLKEAFAHVESECWRLFKEVAPEDVSALAQIKAIQYAHLKYSAFLRSVVSNGAVEKLELEHKRARPPGY
jgi:hypothetical protein